MAWVMRPTFKIMGHPQYLWNGWSYTVLQTWCPVSCNTCDVTALGRDTFHKTYFLF